MNGTHDLPRAPTLTRLWLEPLRPAPPASAAVEQPF